MFLLFLLSQAGLPCAIGPSAADADLCVNGQGSTNPGSSGYNHAVVCVNILHSQLWAQGGWERVVYSFCHGKRQLKKEQSLHTADRTECDFPSQLRQHPVESCPSVPLSCSSVAKYNQNQLWHWIDVALRDHWAFNVLWKTKHLPTDALDPNIWFWNFNPGKALCPFPLLCPSWGGGNKIRRVLPLWEIGNQPESLTFG